MALLKNVGSWDGSPLGSAGVPNLFGLSPPGRRFVGDKHPNKLGTPTERALFNKAFDTLSTEFILSLSKGCELLNRRSLALT